MDTRYLSSGKAVSQPGPLNPLQLQHLVDSLLAMVISIDQTGIISFVNKASLIVFGYAPEELIGTNILEIITPEDREKVRRYIQQMSEGNPVEHFENDIINKDGTIIPISWAGRWNPSDKLLYCTIRDIVERRRLLALQNSYEVTLRRQLEEKAEMLDRITDGFFVLDNLWRIVYANRQAERAVGKKLREVYKKTIWECFPEIVGSEFELQYRKAITEQVSVSFDACFPGPIDLWAEVNAYPSAKGLSVFFRDITEQKRAALEHAQYEKKIMEQHTQLNEILERITDAFYAVDQNWVIKYFNHKAELLSGKSREEMIGKTVWEAFPKTAGTIIEKYLKKAFAEQAPVYFEAPSNIKPLNLEFSIYPSENGLTVFYRDITEKKKTAEELKKLSLIAKETMNSVVVLSTDSRILWVNEAFTRQTGYQFEEVIGKTPGAVLDGPETDTKTLEYIHGQQRKKEPYRVEILNYKKNGEPYWADVQGQPLFDGEGNLQQFFSIETDITERKNLEKQLEMQRKKLTADVINAQERERSQIGLELHDNVNQVLTTVKLYTELCRDGVGNTSEIMDKSIKLLQESINEIRSLSKRLSAPSLGNIKLIDSVKELVDSVAGTNKICISFNSCKINDLEVSRDLHMTIYRILQEHFTNILRHARASKVSVVLKVEKNNLVLQVKDNGKGFDTSLKTSGIGITNMVTRSESLKGSLQISSAPGKGCKLLVRFPMLQ